MHGSFVLTLGMFAVSKRKGEHDVEHITGISNNTVLFICKRALCRANTSNANYNQVLLFLEAKNLKLPADFGHNHVCESRFYLDAGPQSPSSLEEATTIKDEKSTLKVYDNHAILSGWTFLYRYPSMLPDASSLDTNEPNVIVGVVSKSHCFKARQAIRSTRAASAKRRVFFIMAGPWKGIEQEFHDYGDLIWLNMEEDASLITNKVQLLLHAIHTHVDSYDFVIKASDGSNILLHEVEHHLEQSKSDCWGKCLDSHHAHGMGYALSRDFNECATTFVESKGLFSSKEDVAMGELAELCGITCQQEGWNNGWIQRVRTNLGS